MKKTFFLLFAVGLTIVSLTSCSKDHEPQMPTRDNTENDITKTFPEGSKAKNITVKIPGEVRTRSLSKTKPDVPGTSETGWSFIDYTDYQLTTAVYHNDSLYWQSTTTASSKSLSHLSTGVTVSIPVPKNPVGTVKTLVFCQPIPESEILFNSPLKYSLDLENGSISMDMNSSDFGYACDCFSWFDEITADSTDIILTRPVSQIQVLSKTPESNVLEAGGGTMFSYFGAITPRSNFIAPLEWNYIKNEVYYKRPASGVTKELSLCSQEIYDSNGVFNYRTGSNIIACFFIFAPNNASIKYIDEELNTIEDFTPNYVLKCVSRQVLLNEEIDMEIKPNSMYRISGSDNHSIFDKNADLSIKVDPRYPNIN